ncbi:MAG: APC family permease [Caldiserica bacterium]|jgi:amino acid transporter|nr:APC family permease [Caldisericota bacterium]MDH7562585.1 APC family permease [Caldisericota bacterium]
MEGKFKRVLNYWDLFFFTVCAILVMDTVAASAGIGNQSYFWWILTLFLFFIPYGLITAELGSAWPSQGGIYIWVKEAFGEGWATMTSWLYWINVAFWMPSVYMLFSGTLATLFFPDLSTWGQVAIALGMTWVTVILGIIALEKSKWVPNLGAILKTLIMLFLGVLGIAWIARGGYANPGSLGDFLPTWSNTLAFLPVVVYNYMGFELMSSAGEEIKNPQKNVPKAIIFSGIAIFILYVLGTFGILSVLPLERISIVTGIIDSIKEVMSTFGTAGEVVSIAFGIAILYSFLANMVTWSIGANRVVASTAEEGRLPRFLGHLHGRFKTPDFAYITMGVLGSLLLLGNGFLAENPESIFWQIFAISSLIFLLPYLLMFPAFLKLRALKPEVKRPYMVPGPKWLIWTMALLGEFFIALSCVFFFMPPEGTENVLIYELQLGGLTFLVLVMGLILFLVNRKKTSPGAE